MNVLENELISRQIPVGVSVAPPLMGGMTPEDWAAGYSKEVWIDTTTMWYVYLAYISFLFVIVGWGIFKSMHSAKFEGKDEGKEKTRLLMSDDGDDLLQQGFHRTLLGSILYYTTIALALGTQIFCIVIWISDQIISAKLCHVYWNAKAKALIMAWLLSAFGLMGLRFAWDSVQTLFMLRTTLDVCTFAVIWRRNEDEGEEDEVDALSRYIAGWKQFTSSVFGGIPKGWSRFIIAVNVHPERDMRYFDLMCTRYVYCPESGQFRGSEGCLVMCVREVSSVIDHGGLLGASVTRRLQDYGMNKINVEVPRLFTAMASAVSDPVIIFQLLCMYQVLFFRSTLTAILWGSSSLYGVIFQVFMVRRNQFRVREMAEKSSNQTVSVLREGLRRNVLARDLVPGDVVEILDDWDVPSDMVLLRGQVVVNESNLTGESIPVQKFTIPASDDILDPENKATRKYFLYAGTKVITKVSTSTAETQLFPCGDQLQSTGNVSTNRSAISHAIGVVVRTGAATSKGHLIRDILFPNQFRFKYIDQMPAVFFILCVYGVILFFLKAAAVGVTPASFFYGMTTVSQVVPVWLTVMLSIGQNVAASRLAKDESIFCLAPARIAICGKIRIMCFDKTGTLTKDSIEFVGVQPVAMSVVPSPAVSDTGVEMKASAHYAIVVRCVDTSSTTINTNETVSKGLARKLKKKKNKESVFSMPAKKCDVDAACDDVQHKLPQGALDTTLMQGLACCHALSPVEQDGIQTLIGSELERRMFLSTGWLIDGSFICRPSAASNYDSRVVSLSDPIASATDVEVLRVFEFDHVRQSMGVIVRVALTGQMRGFVKGSYETIGALCTQGVPNDYLEVAQAHAKQGMYVLALATRVLDKDTSAKNITRDEFEKDATLVGLLLFRNEIKPETPEAMRQLREGRIRPVIITGDNALTAIAVARRSNIIRKSPQAAPLSAKSRLYAFGFRNLSVIGHLDPEVSAQTGTHSGHPILLGDVENGVLQWKEVDTGDIIEPTRVYNSDDYRELAVTATAFEYLLDAMETDGESSECGGDAVSDGDDCSSVTSISTSSSALSAKKCRRRRGGGPSHGAPIMDKILFRIRIFARMNPHGKVAAVKQFMQRGFVTGMCGDGGNDCGALRAAHAGIALSDAEASIVSPFSAKSKKATAVPALLREGRGSLVTSLACYKFNVMYGLLVSASRILLMWLSGSNMTEFDFLTIDCLIMLMFAQTMTLARPRKVLSKRSPTSSLFGPSTIISVTSMFFINLIGLTCMFIALRYWAGIPSPRSWNTQFPSQEWWVRGDNYDTSAVFLWCAVQFVNAGLVFTFGGVFRRNAFRNVAFTVVWVGINSMLLYLLFGGPSTFHCLFRINCDDYHSRITSHPILRLVAFCGDGLPFYGEGGNNIFSFNVKVVLFVISFVNAMANTLFHKFVIDGYPSHYYRSKFTERSRHIVV